MSEDNKVLRSLAGRVREVAQQPAQLEKRTLWIRHNGLERTRPMVLCLPEAAWGELVPESQIHSTEPLFRTYEWALRHLIYRWENIHDDYVIEPLLHVPLVCRTTGFGLTPRVITPATDERAPRGADFAYNSDPVALALIMGEFRAPFGSKPGKAHRIDPPLKNPADLAKLHFPVLEVDQRQTDRNAAMLREAVGDILEVTKTGIVWLNCSLIGTFNSLRGMEQVMMDLFERPGWLHEAMDFMAASVEAQLDRAQKNGWLDVNNRNQVISSSLGYSDQLPANDFQGKVRATDQWGHATIQSAPNWAPDMQEEFVLQYQRRILKRYGLNVFGCCEPLNAKNIEHVKKIPRLRKVIVSPWSDVDAVAAALEDKSILAWKPNPSQVVATFDLEASRRELEDVLRRTDGCHREIILKDLISLSGQPQRLGEYTRMARQLAEAGCNGVTYRDREVFS